ncbi:alpha/beta fold hydrolase [Halobacillus litoralis]|uniref:alpha/beta fold hydrolase n=1 Tax=Halobacillus litoralis TaxID=45668 RepID=UPI0013E8A155|nr:alpha/beta fold hydrolase [Halobacillus litoralis]
MYVFVYGSLCKHQKNHDLLNEAVLYAEQAWTAGSLYTGSSYYPLLIKDDTSITYGELYELNENTLEHLDFLEGHTSKEPLFKRESALVGTEKGDVEAFVYYWPHATEGTHVPFNDWKVHQMTADPFIYYFAYGSCMDHVRFTEHKVDHLFTELKGKGELEHYRLGFSHHLSDGGRADIIEDTGHSVEGVVYEISENALEYLYQREGVNTGGYRPTVVDLILNDDTLVQALSFTVLDKKDDLTPPLHYASEIHRGGSKYLSPHYMTGIEQRFLNDLPVRDFYDYLQKRSRKKMIQTMWSKFTARDFSTQQYVNFTHRSSADEAIIIVHGITAELDHQREFASSCTRNADVFLPILRGYVQNRGDIGYIGQFDDDLFDFIHFIEAKGYEKITLIGHSMGCANILRLIRKNPLLADEYIFVAPFFHPRLPVYHEDATEQPEPRTDVDYTVYDKKVFFLMILHKMNIHRFNQHTVAEIPDEFHHSGRLHLSFRLLVSRFLEHIPSTIFEGIENRISIYVGEKDEIIQHEQLRDWVKEKWGHEVQFIKGTDHNHILHHPDLHEAIS